LSPSHDNHRDASEGILRSITQHSAVAVLATNSLTLEFLCGMFDFADNSAEHRQLLL
jgi:hypothetical protein